MYITFWKIIARIAQKCSTKKERKRKKVRKKDMESRKTAIKKRAKAQRKTHKIERRGEKIIEKCKKRKKKFKKMLDKRTWMWYDIQVARRDGWAGLRRTTGNRVCGNPVPRVRIPLSPPCKRGTQSGASFAWRRKPQENTALTCKARVRIRRPKIWKLAFKAQGVRIFMLASRAWIPLFYNEHLKRNSPPQVVFHHFPATQPTVCKLLLSFFCTLSPFGHWTAPNCTDSTKNTPMVENIKI